MQQNTPQSANKQFRTVLWLTVFVLTMVAHLVFDVISYITGSVNNQVMRGLNNGIGAVAITSLAIFFYDYTRANPFNSRDDYFRDFRRLLLVLVVIILPIGSDSAPEGYFEVIFNNIVVAARIFALIYATSFMYRVLLYQRINRTENYLRVLAFGSATAFVISFFATSSSDLEETATAINAILLFVLAIIVFLASKRRSWVQTLTRKEKKTLLFYCMGGFLLGVMTTTFCFNSDLALFYSYNSTVRGSAILMSYVAVFFTVYCERMFWSALFSLPNSSVVERRTFEFSSVAYLNRIAAESTDIQRMYITVTQLAQQATRGSSAWCEIRDDQGKYRYPAQFNITEKQIKAINDRDVLRSMVHAVNEPVLIELIAENSQLSFLYRSVESFAQSLLAVTLYDGKEHVGTIYVTNTQPFAFESDDIRALAAFASSANVALENARLVQDSLQKERYQRELIVGRQIQRKLLPQCNPDIDGYEISAVSDPALEVGGDYYDYFTLANGKRCVLIADVSGKGISAAFYMAKLKGVCLAVARNANNARELVEQINATLFGSMERQMYITLTAVLVDTDGKLSIVRAGHTPALLFAHGKVEIIKPPGLGIGLAKPGFFSTCITERTIVLQEGDILLLYTDGVNEARNPNGEELGVEDLAEAYRKQASIPNTNATNVVEELRGAIQRFALHSMQHDDITMIAIQRKTLENPARRNEQETTKLHEEQ